MPKDNVNNNVIWLPTEQLIQKFNPENPQEHNEENDLPKIRRSLLELGWLQVITLQENGKLISGHGRVMSANHLKDETPEFFEKAWSRFIRQRSELPAEAGFDPSAHQYRFSSAYWRQCPCLIVDLDEYSQKSALIRLNDTQADGRPNPAKIAALLANLPRENQELCGWSPEVAKNFIKGFSTRRETYELAVDEDGVLVDDERGNTFAPEEELEFEVMPTGEVQTISIDAEGVEDDSGAVTQSSEYNPGEGLVRLLLYFSSEELGDFKAKIEEVAEFLEVPRPEGLQIQEWRSKVVSAALTYVYELRNQ